MLRKPDMGIEKVKNAEKEITEKKKKKEESWKTKLNKCQERLVTCRDNYRCSGRKSGKG